MLLAKTILVCGSGTASSTIVVGVTFLKHHTTTPPGGATTHIITPEIVMEDGSKTSPA
jgi:hypothetical protein